MAAEVLSGGHKVSYNRLLGKSWIEQSRRLFLITFLITRSVVALRVLSLVLCGLLPAASVFQWQPAL